MLGLNSILVLLLLEGLEKDESLLLCAITLVIVFELFHFLVLLLDEEAELPVREEVGDPAVDVLLLLDEPQSVLDREGTSLSVE